MYVPNADTQNYPFYRLKLVVEKMDNQRNEQTNQVVKLTNKKRYYKTLGQV